MVFTVSNYKGGVAKTTTAATLGAALAERFVADDYGNVLLIDTDPQGHLTNALGVDAGDRCLSNVLRGPGDMKTLQDNVVAANSAVAERNRPGLWLLPCTYELKSVVDGLLADIGARVMQAVIAGKSADGIGLTYLFEEKLGIARNYFRAIIIDTQPTMGSLQQAIHEFADKAIVPFQPAYLDAVGTGQHTNGILADQEDGRGITIFRLLPTRVRARTNLAREMILHVRKAYGNVALARAIPETIRVSEGPSFGLTIIEHEPESLAAQAYNHLADAMYQEVRRG